MAEIERYAALIIGSGEAGAPYSGCRAQVDRRLMPQHRLPAKQECYSKRESGIVRKPGSRLWT